MAWTNPAHVERLKEHWETGLSASQIAAALAREFRDASYSRCAVIGKVHRLGLGGRAKASAPARASVSKAPARRTFAKIAMTPAVVPVIPATKAPEPEPTVERDLDAPGPNACDLMALTNSRCKWPLGPLMAPASLFCGEPLGPARDQALPPYCPCHMKRALSPANDKRRKSVNELIRGLRRYAA